MNKPKLIKLFQIAFNISFAIALIFCIINLIVKNNKAIWSTLCFGTWVINLLCDAILTSLEKENNKKNERKNVKIRNI